MTTVSSNIITLKQQSLAATIRKYAWPFAYILVAAAGLYNYIQWNSLNFVLGIIALVFCAENKKNNEHSYRYFYAGLLFAIIIFLLPVKTVLYASCICGIIFYCENTWRIYNRLFLLLAVFMSPIFQYLIDVFGFPIRLALTGWAAKLISFTGKNIVAEGNVIVLDGNEFSVDPACMGLNMMVASILAGIIIISIYEKKYGRQLLWLHLVGLVALFIALNIVANLMRIICLIACKIPAENIFHEVIGLVCLAVYAILPSVFIVQFIVKKTAGRRNNSNKNVMPFYNIKLQWFNTVLLVLIAYSSYKIYANAQLTPNASLATVSVAGYRTTMLPSDVVKLESKRALVYVKHIQGFYSSDHNPSICWRGSGYTFQKIVVRKLNGTEVYCALLVKDGEQLYTAWWYDNGLHSTINQTDWRWDEIKSSKPYSIVNITTASEAELFAVVTEALAHKTFNAAIAPF
jgi:exosortase N